MDYCCLSLIHLLLVAFSGTSGNETNTTASESSTDVYIPTEQQIHERILTNYSVEVKPEGGRNERRLPVSLEVKISKINGLDIKKQELSITAFTLLKWDDLRLVWNATEYEGEDKVNLGNTLIWTPDVVLYNDANTDNTYKTHTELYRSKVQIQSTGRVTWNSPVTWKSSCKVDSTWFPVDRQVCNLTFGSWSYNEKQLRLSFKTKPTSKAKIISDQYHISSGEWELTAIESYEEEQLFDCCKEAFSTITVVIHLRRYPMFYFIYIFLPLISQLVLFMIIFHIPPDSGERLGFGVTILLNITMYMILISEKLPEKSDNNPMLGIVFVTLFYLLSTGLGLSAITMLLSQKKTEIPEFFRKQFFKEEKRHFQPTNKIALKEFDRQNQNLENLSDQGCARPNSGSLSNGQVSLDNSLELANWSNLMQRMDKILFYLFLVLLVLLPVIICSSLDTTGLA